MAGITLVEDDSFFPELKGILDARKQPKKPASYDPLSLKATKEPKQKGAKGERKGPAPKALINTLVLSPSANPCAGCPFESKPKIPAVIGNLDKAKLMVVTERLTEQDMVTRGIKNDRYNQFMKIFLNQGFSEEDIYWVALTRCPGQEDLTAVEHCAQYLRQELQRDNIKATLLLGVRTMQLLIDQKRNTIFKARGDIFELCGKPCLVTAERAEI